MSYTDIFATESRGLYSPPNGNHPQLLPDLWRESFPDGPIRTDLPDLSNEELNALGWKGPITMPPLEGTSYFTHYYEWNKETREYDAFEFDEFEKRLKVQYQTFWDLLLDTNAYTKIKLIASQSLAANTLATEFIALINDAKRGEANIKKIQQVLSEIILNIPFTEEEFVEIQEIFTKSGMFAIYTLT
jgi:hypothetical protein